MNALPPFRITLVSYPTAQKAALYGLTDLFALAERFYCQRLGRKGPFLEISSLTLEEVGALNHEYEAHKAPSAIILPPSLTGPPPLETISSLLQWLCACHKAGTILGAVCSAGFILAKTGLLDGRPAATHWSATERLQQEFPAILVKSDRLLVDDDDLITVGGIMSWVDLGLCLIEKFLGPAIMHETARYMLVEPPRKSQAPYRSFTPSFNHGDASILKVQHWLKTREAQKATTAEMAHISGLTERTFLRRFRKATGTTPLTYLHHHRIEKGRGLLETTHMTLQQVAWETGYQDSNAFRKIFTRLTGLTPAQYRRQNLST
ncbi:helix-turn-helix domain-containing protein [Acetobacteraceae bacterium ESL0709]|nr:helix-turn-helix domain-containing protein [Acetobacteraceae bacterium ESL0697]MDF7677270.1 helix-turn-helix domain-containing protein [Acetobacteraceae bacterium ESL0709]